MSNNICAIVPLLHFEFLQMENTSSNNNATRVPACNTEVEAPNASIQQPQIEIAAKKRKETKPKSTVWQFFQRIKDESCVVIKGKCLYCAVVYNCHSKRHDIFSLKNHILHCMKIQ